MDPPADGAGTHPTTSSPGSQAQQWQQRPLPLFPFSLAIQTLEIKGSDLLKLSQRRCATWCSDEKTSKAFVSESGKGGEILFLSSGTYSSAPQHFDEGEADNKAATWILRFDGFIMMTLGLYPIFRPISVITDRIPCVRVLELWLNTESSS
jgi:hypothetical protein